jgi:LmbE family N-acetylglucosaminyl deacetylase
MSTNALRFSRSDADVFVPSGGSAPEALARLTHLCVGAHHDDIEIMAHAAICDCLDNSNLAFGGVVVTDGAGSPRTGAYANVDASAMRALRRDEQREAARLGGYALQVQLAHPSAAVKERHPSVVDDLRTVFSGCKPQLVLLHQPADKHDTHVAVFLRCLEALRSLPAAQRPARVLGCEVWRDLDWLDDARRVALDSGRRPELGASLLRVFRSQVEGGKRYDLATLGRRTANATFFHPNAVDGPAGVTWAMDLTPLVHDETLDPVAFTVEHVERLRQDVEKRLRRAGAV